MLDEAVGVLDANHRSAGWEILLVSDGSTDKTIDVALEFARRKGLSEGETGTIWAKGAGKGTIRVVVLEENRGKGGAVVHGMRHARGRYIVFADADGASRFGDLEKLVRAADRVADEKGRAVAIGSRAHLVGSEEVVKVWFSETEIGDDLC